VRADVLLVERGLADSRAQAQRLVMAGQVRVDGQLVLKPSSTVPPDAKIQIERGPRYVSRGGEKLEAALDEFNLDVSGKICADLGASTGGFTDCMLQHGAAKVYAIDVGKGILHWKLRQDPRVVVMEDTNARYVLELPEPVQIITVDASFISLKVLLPVLRGWFPPRGGEMVALIKPQFEAGRSQVARGEGVIRDPSVHYQVLMDVLNSAQQEGYGVHGLMRSPLQGPKGNVEFLAYMIYVEEQRVELEELVGDVIRDFQGNRD